MRFTAIDAAAAAASAPAGFPATWPLISPQLQTDALQLPTDAVQAACVMRHHLWCGPRRRDGRVVSDRAESTAVPQVEAVEDRTPRAKDLVPRHGLAWTGGGLGPLGAACVDGRP